LAVASCGLLPRTTRPGPRLRTAFWSVASLPLRDTRQSRTWSAPITECSVILSEASLRAQSKDPQLVASSAWVADPSQAQDDIRPCVGPETYGTAVLAVVTGACGRPTGRGTPWQTRVPRRGRRLRSYRRCRVAGRWCARRS